MNLRLLFIFTLVFSSFTLINGCSNMASREKASNLQSSVRAYGQAIRWARYKNAHDFHIGKDGFKPKLILDKYDGIKVTAYEIIEDGEINEEMTEANILAEISFYNEDYGTVNKIRHRQHWWFEEESKKWLLDASLPEFK